MPSSGSKYGSTRKRLFSGGRPNEGPSENVRNAFQEWGRSHGQSIRSARSTGRKRRRYSSSSGTVSTGSSFRQTSSSGTGRSGRKAARRLMNYSAYKFLKKSRKGVRRYHKARPLTTLVKQDEHVGAFNNKSWISKWMLPKKDRIMSYDWKSLKNSVMKHYQIDQSQEITGHTGRQGVATMLFMSNWFYQRLADSFAETDSWREAGNRDINQPIYSKTMKTHLWLQSACGVPFTVKVWHLRCKETHNWSTAEKTISALWQKDLTENNDMSIITDPDRDFAALTAATDTAANTPTPGQAFSDIPSIYSRGMTPLSSGSQLKKYWSIKAQKVVTMNPGDLRKITIYHAKHKKIWKANDMVGFLDSTSTSGGVNFAIEGHTDAVLFTCYSNQLGTTTSGEKKGANTENWFGCALACKAETHVTGQVIPYSNVHHSRVGRKLMSFGCPTSNNYLGAYNYATGGAVEHDPFGSNRTLPLKGVVNENTNIEGLKMS